MSTGVVAAGAAAVALYVYLKQKGLQDGASMEPVLPVEASRNAPDHAPTNWSEALFHVKEVLKYMIHETLGRWHTIDLFVGLAYLSHREALDYPAADIAAKGFPVTQNLCIPDRLKLMLDLQEARRYMLYCKGLKLRREEMQARFWKEHLGADTLTIVKQQPTAGVLRPAYVVVNDRMLRAVVLCIRGTHSMKDLFTSLAGAAKPHHVVDPVSGRLVLGYSHLGMLAAARWLLRQVTPLLRVALEANPGYQLRIVGHSMGGGTAALLTMMFRDGAATPLQHPHPGPGPHSSNPSTSATSFTPCSAAAAAAAANGGLGAAGAASPPLSPAGGAAVAAAEPPPPSPSHPSPSSSPVPDSCLPPGDGPFRSARCVAIACPSVVTLELAAACRDYVTAIVNGTDIVPTFCADSVDRLREDVTRSSWFSEFSRDMRSGVVRALQGGVRGVGTATQWTSRNILQPAVVPFKACYATTATRRGKRRAGASLSWVPTSTNATAGTPLALSTPNLSALTAAEQQEQLLLAAGAGGGAAAAAAAAAAVAALDSSPGLSPLTSASSSALLAALAAAPGGPAGAAPPPAQSMSPDAGWGSRERGGGLVQGRGRSGAGGAGGGLDERAMAEAVQSCMYAVESAVSAHQHHQHQQQHQQQAPSQPSSSGPAIAEALSLLESLPPELGTARSAGHHHNHHNHHQRSASGQSHGPGQPDPRGSALQQGSDPGPSGSTSGGSDSGGGGGSGAQVLDEQVMERETASLIAGGAANTIIGAGGVSSALAYGSSLRRRLWPWGQGQGQDGVGYSDASAGGPGPSGAGSSPMAGAAAGAFSAGAGEAGGLLATGYAGGGTDDGAGGGVGAMLPPHVTAPDSPGKAKAAAATAAAAVPLAGAGSGGVGGFVGAGALSSTRSFGDWLWRGGGMLFTTCTAPRRPFSNSQPGGGVGPRQGQGLFGLGGGTRAVTTGGAVGAGGGGRGAGAAGTLEMDVGDGFDDESDPDEGSEDMDEGEEEEEEEEDMMGSEEDEEDEDEEGLMSGGGPGSAERRAGGGGGGPSGSQSGGGSGGAAAESEQQLQAGITAVVAAVTNQASREAAEGPQALLHDETARAAEEVLREANGEEGDDDAATAGVPGAARRAGGSSGAATSGGTTVRRARRTGSSRTGANSAARAGRVRSTAGGGGGAPGGGCGVPRAASDAGFLAGRAAATGSDTAGASAAGAGTSTTGRTASYTAEYEARLYRRRLYPAGRILHLFPAVAVAGSDSQRGGAASGGPGPGAGSGSGAAASTTAADAAAARTSAAQAPYVLYEIPDRQAYSRVRLCRTMVSDHLIPAYLTALDSVLSELEEQQQREARRAWEADQEREQQLERSAGGSAGQQER